MSEARPYPGSVVSFTPAPEHALAVQVRWPDGLTYRMALVGWAVVVVDCDDAFVHHRTEVQPVMLDPLDESGLGIVTVFDVRSATDETLTITVAPVVGAEWAELAVAPVRTEPTPARHLPAGPDVPAVEL